MADVEIKTQEPEQPNQPDRPSSGYSRLRNRHRELIAAHEALRNDHEVLRAAYAQLEGDVQRLLEQHTRVMQAVRSGPSWPEMAAEALEQLAARPNPSALQGTAAALAQLQNHFAAIVARAGGYT